MSFIPPALRALAAVLSAGAVLAPAASAAESPDPDVRTPWSSRVTLGESASELGLPAGAPRSALAIAGARRAAARLGIDRAELGRLRALPRGPRDPAGVVHLRQTLGGLRVLWSQLDVALGAGRVDTVSGTLLPLRAPRLTGTVRISRAEAVAIARRRVKGPDFAGAASLVAYAGDPDRPRSPRRAYVLSVDPAAPHGHDDSPVARCVVVDAQSGRVLAVWDGTVTPTAAPRSRGARIAASTTTLAQYEDAKGRTSDSSLSSNIWDLRTNGDPFATYDTTGGFFAKTGSPTDLNAILPGSPPWLMRRPIDTTTTIARFFCMQSRMFWCGRNGGRVGTLSPGYHRWFFSINWDGPVSGFKPSQERVYLKRGFASFDEQIHAHEMGHVIDHFSRDDFQSTFEGAEVQEALGEMFAFAYYRFRPSPDPDACSISQKMTGVGCSSLAHHYADYSCTTGDVHANGYILGIAFAQIANRVGFDDATQLLREVPRLLPAKRTFGSVHQAFEDATTLQGMPQHRTTVHDAFIAAGVTVAKRRTSACPGAGE